MIKIVEWNGHDLLKLMRIVVQDLYAATRNWNLFLRADDSKTLDYNTET